MDRQTFSYYTPFCWARYTKKLAKSITHPKHWGHIESEEGKRVALAVESSSDASSIVKLYLLVDEAEGKIEKARFVAFAESACIGAVEALCDLIEGKNYLQAKRISSSLIDKHLRDVSHEEAFPSEVASHMNLALFVLEIAIEQCLDIPLPEKEYETPLDLEALQESGEYPDWENLAEQERISLIEKVIEADIKPYIELDEGGVKVKKLEKNTNVRIEYQGSCTSCFSATTSTLSAIQQILRAKVHPELTVIPEGLAFL